MDDTLGHRIAALRRQRRLSQKELATELGRSVSWMSQVERGVQPVERLSVLRAIADALGVTAQDLDPRMVADKDSAGSGANAAPVNDLDALRICLSGHPTPALLLTGAADTSQMPDIAALSRRVDHAWELVHASRFAELSAELTQVLPQLESAVRTQSDVLDADLHRLHLLRARSYQAAAVAFARQDEPDAAWVAADRAITAAEQVRQPLDVIAGHFRLAHAFMHLKRYDQADHVATTALEALEPLADAADSPPEVLSLYGAMQLVAAVICSREDDRTRAHHHLQRAQAIADRLGKDRNDHGTEFGPTNVQLHHVAVAVDLGDAGQALDVAQQIDPSNLSPERQARFHLDVARAHALRRHVGDALQALLTAENLAPEQAHTHRQARETVEDLLTIAAHRASAELISLAQRFGVVQ